MQTDRKQREDIEEDIAYGKRPSLDECRELLEDAALGEQLEEELDALKEALLEVGLKVIDTTTDEDEHRTLEIVSVE